jgi:hypothetical protein
MFIKMMNLVDGPRFFENQNLDEPMMEFEKEIQNFLHDIEWILSGDYRKCDEKDAVEKMPKEFLSKLLATLQQATDKSFSKVFDELPFVIGYMKINLEDLFFYANEGVELMQKEGLQGIYYMSTLRDIIGLILAKGPLVLNCDDINMVVDYTRTSRKHAVKVLRCHQGDPDAAIKAIQNEDPDDESTYDDDEIGW